MPGTINSTNMNLPVPVPGTEDGPQWAQDLANCLTLIDQHQHSAGYGVLITPGGLNINSDFTLNSHNLVSARSLRLTPYADSTAFAASASDLGALIELGADLYYIDGNGNQIRITQSGNVKAGAGSIDGLVSPATATYVPADSTFVFQAAVNTAAILDVGTVIVRRTTLSGDGVSITAPNALTSGGYSLTLPAAPSPSGLRALVMDTSGNVSTPLLLAAQIDPAANIAGTQLLDTSITGSKLANATITTTQIANSAVTGAQIATAAVTGGKIASGTITRGNMGLASVGSANIINNVNLPGKNCQEEGRCIVVANEPNSLSYALLRGAVDAGGATVGGEGFTPTPLGSGRYRITYATPFADTPMIVVTSVQAGVITYSGYYFSVFNQSNTSFDVEGWKPSTSAQITAGASGTQPAFGAFQFIAIGYRT